MAAAAADRAAERSGVAVSESAPNRYEVRGALTFGTARRALDAGRKAFAAASGPIEVDLGRVASSDSAGLAVLIEWLAWARRGGRQIRFSHVPEALCAIARICELEELLRAP
ncbi:MAG TPA: STAS domain-containing protein [Steroidobacteraceae bacterium]|nr:STAS domain-containing protein [Steroidobacteraceae bacterium]